MPHMRPPLTQFEQLMSDAQVVAYLLARSAARANADAQRRIQLVEEAGRPRLAAPQPVSRSARLVEDADWIRDWAVTGA